MKLVTAIIQPDKVEQVREELLKNEIYRITVSRASGRGRQSEEEIHRGHTVPLELIPKIRVDIACNEEFVRPTVDAILRAARHGKGELGDGKIFVTNLEECIRIRTGEDGGEAI